MNIFYPTITFRILWVAINTFDMYVVEDGHDLFISELSAIIP